MPDSHLALDVVERGQRGLRGGRPALPSNRTERGMIDELAIERFWRNVDKRGPDDCWPWLGYGHKRGYGVIMLNRALYKAHRFSCELYHGPSNGLFALHSCDNPSCVNPRHLRWGTHQENMKDRAQRTGYRHALMNRTHCSKGHELKGGNIIRRKGRKDSRECRECQLDRCRNFHAKRKLLVQ